MGTISNFDLMAYATTALAGTTGLLSKNFGEALPQILEIAKAANKANPALVDVDYMFQSLVVGIKRLSPRLIDNLGIQLKLSDAYKTYAESLGITSKQLTAEEKQMALLNEVLAKGDTLLEQVGGSAASLTDHLPAPRQVVMDHVQCRWKFQFYACAYHRPWRNLDFGHTSAVRSGGGRCPF